MRTSVAVLLGVLAVAAAIGAGLAFGRLARPAPTPVNVIVTPTSTLTPRRTPLDETALFTQPLSAGCATAGGVWVVTNGGGILRYDGTTWDQVDDTLRSLTAVTCTSDVAFAAGLIGTLVVLDETRGQIRATDVSINDLYGIASLDDGALMVGAVGSIYLLAGGDVQPFARGIEEDLRDVVAFSQQSAWVVGAGGNTYRLDQRGWNPVSSGQTNTLRAVAARGAASVFAVGDGGTFVAWDNGWHAVPIAVTEDLRDLIVEPGLWIAGNAGVLLKQGATVGTFDRVDLGTTCDLVSVFARGTEVWVVGATRGGGGVWRLRPDGSVAQKWGRC